jgi:hypothetical protein
MMKGRTMLALNGLTKRMAFSALLLPIAMSWAASIDSGMVLLKTIQGGDHGQLGKLELIYLSTMDTVVLQDGGVGRGARFSPDGQKVCYLHPADPWNQIALFRMNIDGTDKRLLCPEIGTMHPCWTTNGYVYLTGTGGPVVKRVPENGGPAEIVWENTADTLHPARDGTWAGNNMYESWVSLDGTRAVGTVTHYREDKRTTSGYCQLNIDLTTGAAASHASPCQSGISPSGNYFSLSAMTHRAYRIVPWDNPFVVFDSLPTWPSGFANSYDFHTTAREYAYGGEHAYTAPTDDIDALLVGPDVVAMYGLDPSTSDIPECGIPTWSSTDEDMFLFFVDDNVGGRPTSGAYLRVISSHEYLKVGETNMTRVYDYFPQEIRTVAPYTLTPTSMSFSYAPGSAVPAAKTVSVSSLAAMTGAPAVRGTPSWLSVTVAADSPTRYVLTNSLVEAQLPAAGDYSATITVTPSGTMQNLTYSANLHVGEAPDELIVIHSPTEGQTCTIGDILHICFSAENPPISGTVVSLSMNGGETYTRLHNDAAYASGDSVVLDYVLTNSLLQGTTASGECIVRVGAYPSGYNVYTGLFTIQTASGGLERGVLRDVSAADALVSSVVNGDQLILDSQLSGRVRLFDIQGRTARTIDVVPGRQTVSMRSLRAGKYFLARTGQSGPGTRVIVISH